MRKKKQDGALTENLRIRFYLMGLIHRNALKSVRIPSSRELSEHFHVARSTVQLVLNKLCEENWLIARHGIGTFSNPSAICPENAAKGFRRPLIGVIYGNGDYFFYNYAAAQGLGCVFRAAAETGALVHHLQIPPDNPESTAQKILERGFDAIVWIDGLERMKQVVPLLAEQGLPVAVIDRIPQTGAVTVRPVRGRAIRALAAQFQSQTGRGLILEPYLQESILPACRQYFTGVEWKTLPVHPPESAVLEKLRALLRTGYSPDLLLTTASFIRAVPELLTEFRLHSRLVSVEDCAESDIPEDAFMIRRDFPKEAEAAVREILSGSNRVVDIECTLFHKNKTESNEDE